MLPVVRHSSDWFVARTDNRTNNLGKHNPGTAPTMGSCHLSSIGARGISSVQVSFSNKKILLDGKRGLPGRSNGRFVLREKLQISTVRITHAERRELEFIAEERSKATLS